MDFADALPFLAAGILILTAATAFQGTRFLTGRRVMALTAAVLFLIVSGIYVLQSLAPWDRLTPCLAAAGLTGAAAWFFMPLFQPREAHPDAEGVLFLTAALRGPGGLEILGLSIGRTLLCVLLALHRL